MYSKHLGRYIAHYDEPALKTFFRLHKAEKLHNLIVVVDKDEKWLGGGA